MSDRTLMPSMAARLSMAISGPPGIVFYGRSALEPGGDMLQVFTRVSGELDMRSLERGWRRAADQQALLTATRRQDRHTQRFYLQQVLPVMSHDWRGIQPGDQGERLAALIREEARLRCDWGPAPVMRLMVIRLAVNSRLFLLTVHHLVGGCAAVLFLIDGLRRLIAQSRPSRLTQRQRRPIPMTRTA